MGAAPTPLACLDGYVRESSADQVRIVGERTGDLALIEMSGCRLAGRHASGGRDDKRLMDTTVEVIEAAAPEDQWAVDSDGKSRSTLPVQPVDCGDSGNKESIRGKLGTSLLALGPVFPLQCDPEGLTPLRSLFLLHPAPLGSRGLGRRKIQVLVD